MATKTTKEHEKFVTVHGFKGSGFKVQRFKGSGFKVITVWYANIISQGPEYRQLSLGEKAL